MLYRYVKCKWLFVAVYNRRGSFLSTTIFVYALSSPINGYFGGSLYSRMGGMCVFDADTPQFLFNWRPSSSGVSPQCAVYPMREPWG